MNRNVFWCAACVVSLISPGAAYGRSPAGALSTGQMDRVQACRRLLGGANERTAAQISADLTRSAFPEENLQILEAEARTFAELVLEQGVTDPAQKEWLYNMIALNMAYLQFGGINIKQSDDKVLNKMIRRKLREHLPAALQENKKFFELVDW